MSDHADKDQEQPGHGQGCESEHHGHEHHGHGHDHDHDQTVTIRIGDKTLEIKPGQYTVAQLKAMGGVPAADELEQVIGGKLTPLPDNGSVTIKGCEVFIGHPKDGGSS